MTHETPCLLRFTSWVYNSVQERKSYVVLGIILYAIVLVLSPQSLPEFLQKISNQTLRQAFEALNVLMITVMVMLGAILIAMIDRSLPSDKKKNLWQEELVNYFRYTFVLIAFNLASLFSIPSGVGDMGPWAVFWLITAFILNLYGVFLSIKGSEDAFDKFL